jgi:hypothetical protein
MIIVKYRKTFVYLSPEIDTGTSEDINYIPNDARNMTSRFSLFFIL